MDSMGPEVLETCIDNWKNQLLDTTGRNRALFYRQTRSTLTIHQSPSRVWNDLVEEGALFVNESELGSPVSDIPPVEEDSDDDYPWIDAQDSARKIKTINEIARTFDEEQGVHVTHAVFGWLKWTDDSRTPRDNDESVTLKNGQTVRVVRTPLIFVPVNIQKETRGCRLTLETNSSIDSNITLERVLRELYDLEVGFDPEEIDLDGALAYWDSIARDREEWEVYPGDNVLIDTFSFKKIALLKEMELSKELIAKQPLLRLLCGDTDAFPGPPAVPGYESLDDHMVSDQLSLVVPADASQMKAILAVNQGNDLVIQGPPGTGKSQTITNIISTKLAQGERVLFVAEKRQAREIVVNNLDEAGLGDLILHITQEVVGRRSTATSKQEIADQIGDILGKGPGYYEFQPDVSTNHQTVKDRLNSYSNSLHSPLGARRQSAFQLIARWAELEDEYPSNLTGEFNLPNLDEADAIWLQQAIEAAIRVDDLDDETLSDCVGPWLNSELANHEWGPLEDLRNAVSQLASCQQELKNLIQIHLNSDKYINENTTFDQLNSLALLLAAVGHHNSTQQMPFSFFRPAFWRTRSDFMNFMNEGGRSPESTGSSASNLRTLLEQVVESQEILGEYFANLPDSKEISSLASFGQELFSTMDSATSAIKVLTTCRAAQPNSLSETLLNLIRCRTKGQSIRQLLELSLAKKWAQEGFESTPALDITSAVMANQARLLEECEEEVLKLGQTKTLNATVPYRPSQSDYAIPGGDLQVLRSQVSAKRRRPLRWLFSRAGKQISQIKPCIVASPLAVAQFLHADSFQFDLVIFDEASQIPTADAVVPISRAKQVVIVGDSQQMPPTTFFDRARSMRQDDDELIYESVLGQCESLLPSSTLLWHYRSEDERLIAFSNRNFYRGELRTFPSSWDLHPDLGVKFHYLPDAVYGRGGSAANPMEAERVVEILEEELSSRPENTVGVTAMSIRQSVEIQDRIEMVAANNDIIQGWLDDGGRARNLETIQGDEFDVSILSFGYGKDEAGTPQLNFGPLSRDDGYRRLNVAITRARKKTIVVTSLRASDIDMGRVGSGGQLVRSYLDYAERGPIALGDDLQVSGGNVYESIFEEEVARQVRARGWQVDSQIGVSRYRIDLGIRHPNHPGRFLAGIECDGATYHSAETARDRDVARQTVLERRGWSIYRIWSTEWFRNRERVLSDLQSYLRDLLDDDGDSNGTGSKPPSPTGISVANKAPVFRGITHGLEPGTLNYARSTLPLTNSHIRNAQVGISSPIEDLSAWIAKSIESTGPWHRQEIVGFGRRMGIYSPSVIYSALNDLETANAISVDGDIVWPVKRSRRTVPIKITRSGEPRDLKFYSDEELLRSMELACDTSIPLKKSDVAIATARFLGYPRTAPPIRKRIDELIDTAIQRGFIEAEEPEEKPKSVSTQRPDYGALIASNARASIGSKIDVNSIKQSSSSTSAPSRPRSVAPIDRLVISKALEESRPLRISYQNRSGHVTQRTVDVYGIGGSYIDAFDRRTNSQRTFRLDRIIEAEFVDGANFQKPSDYQASRWVRN
jgi:very-short-patch-repair endonuclease